MNEIKQLKVYIPERTSTYLVQWIETRPFMYYHVGKTWPKQTTCKIFYLQKNTYNEDVHKILRAEDFVIKHDRDVDNFLYAARLSLTRAIKQTVWSKSSRKYVWKKVNKYLKDVYND